MESKTCTIVVQPYLNQFEQCYSNILTINLVPAGPLKKMVTKIKTPPLSIFQTPGSMYTS